MPDGFETIGAHSSTSDSLLKDAHCSTVLSASGMSTTGMSSFVDIVTEGKVENKLVYTTFKFLTIIEEV